MEKFFMMILTVAIIFTASVGFSREHAPIGENEFGEPDWERYSTGVGIKGETASYVIDPDNFSMKCYRTAYITWHNGLITKDGLIRIDAEV